MSDKRRSVLGGLLRFYGHPYIYGYRSLRRGFSSIQEKLVGAAQRGEGDQVKIEDAAFLKDKRDLFMAHYKANGWTESELERQLLVVRASKRFAKWSTLVAFLMSLYLLVYCTVGAGAESMPFLYVLIVAIGFLSITVLGFGRVLKMGHWQHQLEARSLDPMSVYLARSDLRAHLLN